MTLLDDARAGGDRRSVSPKGRRRRRLATGAVAVAICLASVAPPGAGAAFHLMSIREVYPGSAAAPGAEYVELQMYASGQNFVAGHSVTFYGPDGAPRGSDTFPRNVPNGQSQRTVLIGTPAAEAQFETTVDAAMTPERLDPSGGAVCFTSIDCVAWGGFGAPGVLPSPAGTPAYAAGIPDGRALRRTIARGCATLLEAFDDTDNSAADFVEAFPEPRPNSVAPTEFPCSQQAGGGGTGGGGGAGGGGGGSEGSRRLQTRIVRGPGRVSRDRTPTFRFRANRRRAAFQCKMDRRGWRRCRSPVTWRRLRHRCHTFRARARSGRLVDRTPAVYRFRIVKRRQPGLRQFRRCRRNR